MSFNISRGTDSYKFTHHAQYPAGTETVYSYFEARRGLGDGGQFPRHVFFGLQYFLQEYLEGVVVTDADIRRSAQMAASHFGNAGLYNAAGWQHIVDKHGGRLPVSIRAIPEGQILPMRNALITIENTDPACYWLTNWLETVLVQCWYMTTVATNSWYCRNIIQKYLQDTGTPESIAFKLHDFGYRGVSCPEQAACGGAAHLVSFRGTDTFAAIDMLYKHYLPADDMAAMPGFSIPASEHSTITSWGADRELDAFRNMLDAYPTGLVACVSDSYDIYRACRQYWGTDLRDRVMARNGTLVVRPDSGYPVSTVLEVLEALGNAFGTEKNEKGYRVLPPQVRVIQGDGIDLHMIECILEEMYRAGWSADNLAFGSGGGLLQRFDRDTLSFAFKCSSITVGGQQREVYKDPVGGSKTSKRGRLKVIVNRYGDLATEPEYALGDDQLVEVFRDGKVLVRHDFDAVRKRAGTS